MEIESICVVGGGTMGRGIAHVSALAGYRTALYDVEATALESARASIEKRMRKGVELGKLEEADVAAALERLTLHTDLGEAASGARLVIEAAPEVMGIKKEIFAALAGTDAIFATNTSGLSVTEMAAATDRPERFVGMHFFNPVHLMKLVEIVRGLQTSPSTIEAVREVAVRMGKECVVVRDSAGFVTSRVNALIGNEAFRMLETGIATAEEIDRALKLGLNHPMGPFELVDLVGLDVRYHVLENLQGHLGEAYRPSPLMKKYVEAGRLGRKVGLGVYRYDGAGNRLATGKD